MTDASVDEPAVDPQATRVSGRRAVAHLVDGTLYTIIAVFAILPFALLPSSTFASVLLGVALVAVLTVGHVAYFVLFQRRDGRTPGKSITGIRVVDERGATPTMRALIKRTVPLLIEYLYVFAWIAMMSSARRQRLGDRWGRTYVVRGR